MSEPASPPDVIERLIQGISKGRWLELHELYAEDAVVEYPFALPSGPARLAGRSAIRRYFAAVACLPLELKARHVMVHETRDPEVVIAAYAQQTGIEGYQGTPGNRGAWLLWRIEGNRAEFITVSFWESREAIEAFAGQDINTAVFYPDDEQFLTERDLTVNHYEVASTE